jgi:hypothetical protein
MATGAISAAHKANDHAKAERITTHLFAQTIIRLITQDNEASIIGYKVSKLVRKARKG